MRSRTGHEQPSRTRHEQPSRTPVFTRQAMRMHALVLAALVALGGMVAVPRLDSAPAPRTTLLVLGDS